MPSIKQRSFLFDNLKALFIFLVVLGHILELFLKNPVANFLYIIIYSFHMPAFVFIAGYFAKNIDKQQESLVFDFFVPYVVFNSFYQILSYKNFGINLFIPVYVYWFLISMFFWKVFLKNFIRIRFVFFFAVILSLYCGIFDNVSRYLSISRTLVFLPYFLAGYFCQEETITKIKKTSKITGLLLFFVVLGSIIFLFESNIFPLEILKGADSYNKLGISVLNGIFFRIILLLIATGFIIALINITPNKKLKVSFIGNRTLVIYLLHPFFITIINKFCRTLSLLNDYEGVIVCLIFAIAITTFLSNSFLTRFYGYFTF
jgi:fucose 4-O-acetylase-like acetyltransferase